MSDAKPESHEWWLVGCASDMNLLISFFAPYTMSSCLSVKKRPVFLVCTWLRGYGEDAIASYVCISLGAVISLMMELLYRILSLPLPNISLSEFFWSVNLLRYASMGCLYPAFI